MGSNCPKKLTVLYHGERKDDKFLTWDAVGQEIKLLSQNYGNRIFAYSGSFRKRLLQLSQRLPFLLERIYFHKIFCFDKKVNLHHLFFPRLSNFRFLRKLKKPLIYSSVAKGMGFSTASELIEQAKKMDYVRFFTVACEEDKKTLNDAGIKNVAVVLPGINLDRFRKISFNPNSPRKLLMATPPTSFKRFENRGINLILDTLKNLPDLKVTFLWRNVAYEEMKNLVNEKEVVNQVEIVNQLVKPEDYLQESAGAVAVFTGTEGNKAYPNSIIESLASGRPVIVSSIMPIAKIIQQYHCGIVVNPTTSDLIVGIQEYFEKYRQLAENCQKAAALFSQERLLRDYQAIYQKIACPNP